MNKKNKDKGAGLFDVLTIGPARVAISVTIPILAFALLRWSFIFMRDSNASKIVIGLIALLVGVFGVWILFLSTDNLVSHFPRKIKEALRPFVFVGPALTVLGIYLVYPSISTLITSLFNRKGDTFVGLKNYIFALTNEDMVMTLRNNLLWLVFVTFFTVSLGLVIAVLVDKIKWEKIAKSLIFMPMAISFVGAAVIWKFIYYYQPPGEAQIGLLNAIVVALGGDPVGWLIQKPFNNFFLMVIMIWLQTGYAMVILSAAVKGVPSSLMEAARIDGANEFTIFFHVIIPYIKGMILTVTTTILIAVLKIFDIVFVMTSGQYDTSVVALRYYKESFVFRNYGRGSALAVILLIAVVPILIYNIKTLRESRRVR
ncbi:MAG: ABC transporter [Spirochaetaceae bacterium 4572_7]|nr:MAG: ABC transporter [Spirochaetaceae bacterium 4572_7]